MFTTKYFVIFLILFFIIIYIPSFLIISNKHGNKIAFLGSIIPPAIILSIVTLVGNLAFKATAEYVPVGEPESYELFEVSTMEETTADKVCIAYYEMDEAYYEYINNLEFEEHVLDEEGNPVGSDVIVTEDHDHPETAFRYPTEIIKEDLCVDSSLYKNITGYETPKVFIYDAIPNPSKFLSLFSLGAKEDYYIVATP